MSLPRMLRRRIVWLLVVKLAALFGIYLLFFGPAHRVPVDATGVERQFFSAPTASSGD